MSQYGQRIMPFFRLVVGEQFTSEGILYQKGYINPRTNSNAVRVADNCPVMFPLPTLVMPIAQTEVVQ